MSLTTCVRKAGTALSAEDKTAILEAARKNRKAGMSADEAAKAAVSAQLAAVQASIAELAPQVSTWTDEGPKTLKERAGAMAGKKPRLGESAQEVDAAFKKLSAGYVSDRGIVPVTARNPAGGPSYSISATGTLEVLTPDGAGVRDATAQEQQEFSDDLEADRLWIRAMTRPGFGSGYKTQQVIAELHSPSGQGFEKKASSPSPEKTTPATEGGSSPAPLYASRPVTNATDILAWAASQGFKTTLPAADLHVTVAYSRDPMDGAAVPAGATGVSILGGKRTVEPLGDEGAVVLKFNSPEMQARWKQYRDAGASWDYDGYTPHITLTYDGKGLDLSKIEPYAGPIELGAETQDALNVDKAADYKEAEAAPSVAEKAAPADEAGNVAMFSRAPKTDTKAFRDWFGDSKVVDAQGKPLRVYHGTTKGGFTTFNRMQSTKWRSASMDTVGSWFSDNPSEDGGAGMYAAGGESAIYPVYLSIQNPKRYRTFNDFLRHMHRAAGRKMEDQAAPGRGSTEELRAELKADGYDGIEFEQTDNESLMQDVRDMMGAVERAKQDEFSVKRADRLPYTQKRERLEQTLKSMRKELDEFGSSTELDKQRVFIAFEPEQIKSATGNSGAFDPADPDIRFSRGTSPSGISIRDAESAVALIRGALPKGPPIIVLDDVSKAPEALLGYIQDAGSEGDVEAAYHDGRIYVFPQHIVSVERLMFVVGRHEIRHYGFDAMLGRRRGQVLLGIGMKNPALMAAAKKNVKGGYANDLTHGIEEALADMPVAELEALTGWDRLVSAIRQWLRETAAALQSKGLHVLAGAIDPKQWTDRDVAAFVLKAEAISRTGSHGQAVGGTMFSRAVGKATAQDMLQAKSDIYDFNRMGETRQDRARAVFDKARPFWLGALTRDQIADVYGAELPQVRDYDRLVRSMENERSSLAQRADDLYQEWAKLPAEVNDRLARIMLDATVEGVHPDRDAKPADATKMQAHALLRAKFKMLDKDAQAMYGKVREFHSGVLGDIKAGLIERIKRQVAAGAERAALLTKVQEQFDQYLGSGPYFPLHRFGDYLVIATRPDGERVVAAYENAGEQQVAARELRAQGFTTKLKTAKEYSRSLDGSAGKFIGDMIAAVDKVDMAEATINGSRTDLKNQLLDDLNQLFIRALPDLSYRKHFSHRKNTAGFSSDVMRGFASSAFHAASHIARLNHADKMTTALEGAYKAVDDATEGDFNTRSQVLNELAQRHDAMLNPSTHPLAALATQAGFVMYLGLSPAAGLINMMQVPMVTLPYLGARYGFRKASAALGVAYKDIMGAAPNRKSGFNAAQSPKLTPEERQAISTLQDEGVIDLTQAHDLASATDRDVGNVARSRASFATARAMRIVGWTFHVPEVMNRQVTALMAYRMEREKGSSNEAALEAARDAIKRTQFDYSSSNRARYFQGNLARVALQFKQFAQNMTYFLGRAAHQALKGEDPEVRRIARRQILSTFVVTGMMAGTMGMPGVGALGALVGALAGAMGDDDEPWDWQTEYRNMLTDAVGKEWGEVFAKGVPRMLMPAWDVSGRVSLSELWWRSNDREGQSAREAFASDLGNILGPSAGTVLGWYTAADHMQRGQYDKAMESVVPKFIRDPLKALRESSDGITTYNGEPLMDTTFAEEFGRALGFAPARASEMFEGRNAVMNAKTALEEKRQRLLTAVVKARLEGDAEAEAEARSEIAGFNERNPEFKITGMSIAKSLATRRRNRANTEEGILLPDTKASLRERARFANIE
ncbi:MAG: PLxRFG domain-containing protein [Burkholderiaceae bacterium]|nr:PLxRFG domain-containing protein [Burkholderiaceae bacterium]